MFGNWSTSSFLLVLVLAFVVSKADDSVLPTLEADDESRGILFVQKRPTKLTSVHPSESTLTKTVFVTSTTVIQSLATKYCATTANVTGACRRRRGIQEQPGLVINDDVTDIDQHTIGLQPTKVLGVEQTMIDDNLSSAMDLSSSQITISEIGATTIPDYADAQDSLQRANPFLFNLLRVKSTVTTTETLTSTSTTAVTSETKTFTIIGCTPADFSDFSCPQLSSSTPK